MLGKVVLIQILMGMSLFAQQAHLLTSIPSVRQEVVTNSDGVRLIRLNSDDSSYITLANSHRVSVKRDNPKIMQITNDISVVGTLEEVNGCMYYKKEPVKLSKKIISIRNAVIWKGWVICVVAFVEPSNAKYPEFRTVDIVYFRPDKLDAKIIYTGLPALGFEVYIE